MDTQDLSIHIANGMIHFKGRSDKISEIEWTKHPDFEGVGLKHMIRGRDTGDLFSSHLVKIDPECSLRVHRQNDQVELHEVIEGDGECRLPESSFKYHTGKMAVIQRGEEHMVRAGKNGLVILAKFFPALL